LDTSRNLATDSQQAQAAAIAGVATLVVFVAQLSFPQIPPVLTVIPLLLFVVYSIYIRQGVWDHTTLFALATLFYGGIPLATMDESGQLFLGYDYVGGYLIYSISIITILFGTAIAVKVMKAELSGGHADVRSPEEKDRIFSVASLIAGVFSLALSATYIAQHGVVLSNSQAYAEGFISRQETGAGLFLLAVPLAICCVSFSLAKMRTYTLTELLLPIAPFLGLYAAHGQRRFLIIPALSFTVRYFRVRRLGQVIGLVVGIVSVIFLFNYYGFLRQQAVPVSEALNPSTWDAFARNLRVYLGGEATAIYATATAAYHHAIEPLPFGADYWGTPLLLVPQFMFGSLFEPLNDRFALVVTRAAAVRGGGWGFSFFGEAYLNLGFLGVVTLCIATAFFFRYLSLCSKQGRFSGLSGVISLSLIQMSFWFQRNAFAYGFKDAAYQIIAVFVIFGAALVATSALNRRRPNIKRGSTTQPSNIRNLPLRARP